MSRVCSRAAESSAMVPQNSCSRDSVRQLVACGVGHGGALGRLEDAIAHVESVQSLRVPQREKIEALGARMDGLLRAARESERGSMSHDHSLVRRVAQCLDDSRDVLSVSGAEEWGHFLDHAEYEMALEGLVLELIASDSMPRRFDGNAWESLGRDLGLEQESVWDEDFWRKFQVWKESCVRRLLVDAPLDRLADQGQVDACLSAQPHRKRFSWCRRSDLCWVGMPLAVYAALMSQATYAPGTVVDLLLVTCAFWGAGAVFFHRDQASPAAQLRLSHRQFPRAQRVRA